MAEATIETAETEGIERNSRRILRGLVTSDKMTQTIVFTVTRTKQHPLVRTNDEIVQEVQSARRTPVKPESVTRWK